MIRRSLSYVLFLTTALACTSGAAPAPAQGASLVSITVVQTTHSVQDWALDVADTMGFFTANGLHVDVVIAAVAQQLAAGSADIGSVSTTQVVEAILGGAPLVQVLKNVVTTPYALVGRKGIASVEQLRGKTIMIGGPNDITRVFFDRLLSAHGLKTGDYIYTYAGSPSVRYAALLAGAIDATPLLPPTSFSAASQGYPILDDSRKYFPNFPTSGYTANVAWAAGHRPLLVAFIKSVLEGVKWLYDPKNKARALQILEEATNTAPGDAERTYDQYTRQHLFSASGRYDADDFPAVVEMLVQTKQIAAAPPAGTKIYDDSFADEAGRAVKAR
jgi:ABC-type nitrate/sulfonate/bicarbonate transport system substrate-binding protein